MSVLNLSHTAAVYLFYQHRDYISFDKRLRKRYRGMNDPPLVNIIICTVFYVMLTAPRIWSNALLLSITPILTLILFLLEVSIMLFVSHRLATPLNQNASFPSGIVTGVINFLCPCTPVHNLGFINLYSNLFISVKVILLYPIVIFNLLPVTDDKYDRFRCAHIDNISNLTNTTTYRICENGETSNQLLFEVILPITIISLLIVSIPMGFIISNLMTRPRLTLLNESITVKLEPLKRYFSRIAESFVCCCKKDIASETKTKSQQKSFEVQQGMETDSRIRSNDLGINPPYNATERGIPYESVFSFEDVKNEMIIKERSIKTYNLMSFVLNIRAVFDDLQNEDENCK